MNTNRFTIVNSYILKTQVKKVSRPIYLCVNYTYKYMTTPLTNTLYKFCRSKLVPKLLSWTRNCVTFIHVFTTGEQHYITYQGYYGLWALSFYTSLIGNTKYKVIKYLLTLYSIHYLNILWTMLKFMRACNNMVIRSNEIRFMFKLKVDITIRLASNTCVEE